MPCKYFYNSAWTEDPPPDDQILATLKPEHPRLMIDENTVTQVKTTLESDAHAARWYAAVKAEAEEILNLPPSIYEIPDGRRLLGVSRRVKERVRALMFVYMLEGGQRYVDRVWAEIDAAIGFADWNPSHFLDTAEMTHAVAISLDWLYDCWTDEQRRAMREAIITHGLKPGMEVYAGNVGHRWDQNHNNWNQVCNGGLGMGALAIADEHPMLAAEVLYEAIKSIPKAMSYYAPDGAGTEGVTYWSYGMRYNLIFLSGLETALGTDFGLSQIEGFDLSGNYQMYLAGADRMSFNFGDCGLTRMSTPMHFWMGKQFNLPQYSWYRYSELSHTERNGSVLDLLWFDDSAKTFDATTLPLDKHYRKAESASMRSAWDDPNALVVGFEAGLNTYHGHRHQDLGSFILEALGERWVMDSGTESQTYQLHRHKKQRWEYYRVRAEGHNTLVMNPGEGPDQAIDSMATITHFASTPERATAVADLSEVYVDHARRVQRTLEMIDRAAVTVTDEVEADAPIADLWWFMHTQADVTLSEGGKAASLQQNGKQVVVTIETGPDGAAFEVMDAAPLPTSPNPPEQTPNEGVRKLAIHLTNVTDLKLTVKIAPEG